jgi:hypothetical protein
MSPQPKPYGQTYMGSEDLKLLRWQFNLLNAELNPICHLLALLGAHHIFHVSRIGFNGNTSDDSDVDSS